MSHNITHVEGFDDFTKTNYNLLELANTPGGLLGLLPKFMSSLEKDKTCKKAYNKIRVRLIREDEELQNLKQSVIDWMKGKLKLLQRLKCSKFLEVKKAIECAELVLSGQAYEIRSGGYLNSLTWYFEQACRAVAFYDDVSDFEKWLKVTNRKHVLTFSEPILKNPVFDKMIKPSTIEGKQISKRLGHGFVKAFVQSGAKFSFSNEETPHRYTIEWGDVDSVAYPDSLQIWRKNQDFHQSLMQFDQKAEDNLRYLLYLCHFENLKPIPLSSLPKSKSVFEAEALCNHQLLQNYLSGFKNVNWDKAPSSREDIMSKLNRLLVFLRTEENTEQINMRGSRMVKEDARKFVQGNLNNAWDAMEKEGKRPCNYQMLRTAIFALQKTAPCDIQGALSNTLIEKEIREFAKLKKWKPVRGKDRGKRHVA